MARHRTQRLVKTCLSSLAGLAAVMSPLGVAADNAKPPGQIKFDKPIRLPVGDMPRFVKVAQLTPDDKPDLMVSNYARRDMSVLFNQGGLKFGTEIALPIFNAQGAKPADFVLTDLNDDKLPDLVLLAKLVQGRRHAMIVRLSKDDTLFSTFNAQLQPDDYIPESIQAQDINGDGRGDLVLAGSPRTGGTMAYEVFEGAQLKNAASWLPQASKQRGQLPAYCFIDIDGKGVTDAISPNGGATLRRWRGPIVKQAPNGPPGVLDLAKFGIQPRGEVVSVVKGDIDADKKDDLLAVLKQGTSPASFQLVALRTRLKPLAKEVDPFPAMTSLAYINLIDLNADKHADLVMIGTPRGVKRDLLIVMASDGRGGFGKPAAMDIPAGHPGVAFADLNADGKPEFLLPDLIDTLLVYPNIAETTDQNKSEEEKEKEEREKQEQKEKEQREKEQREKEMKEQQEKEKREQEKREQEEKEKREQEQREKENREKGEDGKDPEKGEGEDGKDPDKKEGEEGKDGGDNKEDGPKPFSPVKGDPPKKRPIPPRSLLD